MTTENVIQPYPPRDGRNWEPQCARCGSSVDFTHCDDCEDGLDGHDCGDDCCCCLHPEDNVVCQTCYGHGVRWTCLSSVGWCFGNPLPGREEVLRGQIEWYLDD